VRKSAVDPGNARSHRSKHRQYGGKQ